MFGDNSIEFMRCVIRELFKRELYYVDHNFIIFFWFIPLSKAIELNGCDNFSEVSNLIEYIGADVGEKALFVAFLYGKFAVKDLYRSVKTLKGLINGILFWRTKRNRFEFIDLRR